MGKDWQQQQLDKLVAQQQQGIDKLKLSIVKQSKLLEIHRSGLYYKPKGESALNLELMRLIDEHYTEYCFKGSKRMYTWLTMDKGYKVNQKRIDRLYYSRDGA